MTRRVTHLLVPSFLYGTYEEVRRSAAKAVTALRRGATLAEVAGEPLCVADLPGLVVLDRRWSSIPSSEPMFHVDQVARQYTAKAIKEKDFLDVIATFGTACLSSAWSFLGIVDLQLYACVRTAERQLLLLDAARIFWPSITAVGPRYTTGLNTGGSIETSSTLVHFCLARQGATRKDLVPPVTPERLEELCARLPGYRVRSALAVGDVDSALRELQALEDEIALCSVAEHLVRAGHDAAASAEVKARGLPDPHGIARDWLGQHGDAARVVR
jgi:hypothetical protein